MSENAKETGNFESEFKELRKEAEVLNSDSVYITARRTIPKMVERALAGSIFLYIQRLTSR